MIHRFSSRTHKLGHSYLNERLKDASSYDRIAGYFTSSILEVAGEALEAMEGKVRIICNSDLDPRDVETARSAELALGKEWRAKSEDKMDPRAKKRLERLHGFLKSGKLEVRVLPNSVFGLIHGKAGVITKPDGTRTAFMGSINETYSAWELNYEILWEDTSPEASDWVQEEFDALWKHPQAVPLAQAVVEDIGRLARRTVVDRKTWRNDPDPASAVVETPVYRKEYGLWAHQKYFVKRAFDEHRCGRGARFVLADQVGLGKTVQLALAAMLMALQGERPVLAVVPKTLMWQWQDELWKLLKLPSAVWNGGNWVDELGIEYPSISSEDAILKCPRRFGIVSQGLVVHGNKAVMRLLEKQYECVIVDESHRARRRNLGPRKTNEAPEPNNLMAFLWDMSRRTKSMLLATATPVQLYPIEAYDMVDILARGADHVLGERLAKWQMADKERVLERIMGTRADDPDLEDRWQWMRDPFPPEYEAEVFAKVREERNMAPTNNTLGVDDLKELKPWDRSKLKELPDFCKNHNPLLRHIVRRTRGFLENKIDPLTNEPYLKKVEVVLYGEEHTIALPTYLEDAYATAEEFCKALSEIMRGSRFMRTLLLRRMGSSIEAGRLTALKMLGTGLLEDGEEDDDNSNELNGNEGTPQAAPTGIAARISDREREILMRLVQQLGAYQDKDPKLAVLRKTLFADEWAQDGCIIFSQYYDTVRYFSEQIAQENPELQVAVYAGGDRSGIWQNGIFQRTTKDEVKRLVQAGEVKLAFGTDSASEGLNLQRLGTLVNLDLPWNPTRLEQRKGRIQRIGQMRDTVKVYNMRYTDSVEDRVHQLLAQRLSNIHQMFGQIPDILEDVWVEVAEGREAKAREIIDAVPERNPFEIRYDRIENVDFETCSTVLNEVERLEALEKGW
ncbi:MAG: DEAD/DEAH box helicase family protein [Flavobacteriales bacterium]|nr:DEAD/DEAH box helicase family protein [Flavobacteriales bacterium]